MEYFNAKSVIIAYLAKNVVLCIVDKQEYAELRQILGKKLTQARIDAGILQSSPCLKGIVSQSQLSKIENGELLVNVFVLSKLATLYGKKITDFIE